jgi:glycine cleavage system H protein
MADFPSDLSYTKDHEWARREGNRVRVGITQHAVDALGDVVQVNVDAAVGAAIEAGKAFGTVESVKAVSDLFAPLSGKLVEVNPALASQPELVNESPYDKGWMVVIEAADGAQSELMDGAAYAKFVATLDH